MTRKSKNKAAVEKKDSRPFRVDQFLVALELPIEQVAALGLGEFLDCISQHRSWHLLVVLFDKSQ